MTGILRRFTQSLSLVLWGLLNSANAAALTLDPNPVGFDSFGTGAISIVGVQFGVPSGGISLDGSTAPEDVTVLFSISLQSKPIDGDFASIVIYSGLDLLGITGHEPTGAGWISGEGFDIASASVVTGTHGQSWEFVFSQALQDETVTDVMFASFDSLNPGDFVVFALPAEFVDLNPTIAVPEPGTALPVAAGLIFFSLLLRAQQRSRLTSG